MIAIATKDLSALPSRKEGRRLGVGALFSKSFPFKSHKLLVPVSKRLGGASLTDPIRGDTSVNRDGQSLESVYCNQVRHVYAYVQVQCVDDEHTCRCVNQLDLNRLSYPREQYKTNNPEAASWKLCSCGSEEEGYLGQTPCRTHHH